MIQTIQVNQLGQLACNLDEIGNDLIGKANTDLSNVDNDGKTMIIETVMPELKRKQDIGHDMYGIKGDYATEYGILECPKEILTINNRTITLNKDIVLKCPGVSAQIIISNDIHHDLEANHPIDIFYAKDENQVENLFECGEVYYQEEEPEDGENFFIAWWKPSTKTWQFKSNATGNIWRIATACRIAHLDINNDGKVLKVDYIGNRILNTEVVAEKKDLPKETQLMAGYLSAVETLTPSVSLTTVINKVNELIEVLRTRNVIS